VKVDDDLHWHARSKLVRGVRAEQDRNQLRPYLGNVDHSGLSWFVGSNDARISPDYSQRRLACTGTRKNTRRNIQYRLCQSDLFFPATPVINQHRIKPFGRTFNVLHLETKIRYLGHVWAGPSRLSALFVNPTINTSEKNFNQSIGGDRIQF
jgi:hypothetical protein